MPNAGPRLALILSLMLCATPASATKIACSDSNAQRILTTAILSLPASHEATLEATVATLVEETGSSVSRMEAGHTDTDQVSDEFVIVSGDGNVTVTIEQPRGSSLSFVTVERTCQSLSASGWEAYWDRWITGLFAAGYHFNF